MTTTKAPVLTTESGAKLSRITNSRQLQKFLSQGWQQKSVRIDGAPGLTIHHSGRWHFNIMTNGQRLSTTLGRYPKVSLAEARSKALHVRQNFVETGTRPNQKETSTKRHANENSSPNSSTITIDSLLPEYLHYRYNELLKSQTNKCPDKAVLVMEARYRKHLAPLIGKLHPTQLNNQLVIACLAPIASRKAERTKCLAIVSGLAKWFLLKGLMDANAFPIQQEVIRMALPKKLPPAVHHARMDPADIPRLVALAWAPQQTVRDTLAALGLLLVLLTAQRVGNFMAFDSNPSIDSREWYSQWKDIDMSSRTCGMRVRKMDLIDRPC